MKPKDKDDAIYANEFDLEMSDSEERKIRVRGFSTDPFTRRLAIAAFEWLTDGHHPEIDEHGDIYDDEDRRKQ